MRRAFSSSGAGVSPSSFSRAWTKASMGFVAPATAGTGGCFTGSNAQCPVHVAPSFTQRLSSSTCAGWSGLWSFGGGITSSLSFVVMRRISSLFSSDPGTTATSPDSPLPNAASFTSSRSSALRLFASGPWQVKQFSERIGRMSRLKSSFVVASSARAVAAVSARSSRAWVIERRAAAGRETWGCGGT